MKLFDQKYFPILQEENGILIAIVRDEYDFPSSTLS